MNADGKLVKYFMWMTGGNRAGSSIL